MTEFFSERLVPDLVRDLNLDKSLAQRFLDLDSTLNAKDLEVLIQPLLDQKSDKVKQSFEKLRSALTEKLRSVEQHPNCITLFLDIKNLAVGLEKESHGNLRKKINDLGLSEPFGDKLIKCREAHFNEEVMRHCQIISSQLTRFGQVAAKAQATLEKMVEEGVGLMDVQGYATDALAHQCLIDKIDSHARGQVSDNSNLFDDPRIAYSQVSTMQNTIANDVKKSNASELRQKLLLAEQGIESLCKVSPQAWFSLMPKFVGYRHDQLCEFVDTINQCRTEASNIETWIRSDRYSLGESDPPKIDSIFKTELESMISHQLAEALANSNDASGYSIRQKLWTRGVFSALALYLIDNPKTLNSLKAES